MIGSPGGVARTIGLRVRKNAKPGTSEGLAYIIVKMLAVPHLEPVAQLQPVATLLVCSWLLALPKSRKWMVGGAMALRESDSG